MANKKISQLNAVTTLSNNDVFPVVQGTETKKAKISDIKSYLPTASSLLTGLLSNTDWVTFNNKQNALTLGNLTESTSSVLTITGGTGAIIGSGLTIQVKQASGSQNGFLSSTDWTTFNSKMSSLTLTTTGTSGAATLVGSTLNIPQYLGSAITSLGGQTGATQTFSTDTTGSDFTIASVSNNHKFSIPNASGSARGLLTSSDWTAFNNKEAAVTWGSLTETTSSILTITGGSSAVRGNVTVAVKQVGPTQDGYLGKGDYSTFLAKQNAITLTTTGSSGAATFINDVLNIPQYASGITSLNALTSGTQTFATGSSGSDFNISSSTSTHTFNIPTASASNRGLLSTTDWSTFNGKQGALTLTTTGTSGAATLVGNTLNIPQYSGGGGGISTLNTLTASTQTFATGTSGSDFNISSSTSTHTFNIPDAGASARGVVTTGTQTLAGAKTFSSAPTFSTITAGSILFAGTSGLVSQKNANLFWDNTNNRLGIGTNTPNDIFQVVSSSNFYPNFRNNATGLNSEISFYFQTYDGTTVSSNGGFGATSSNYNFSDFKPNSQYFVADRDGGLGLFAKHASGVIRMYTAGTDATNRRLSIFSGGNVLIQSGGTHTDAGFRLDINGTCRHQGNTTFSDATNLIFGTSTGNKIGTATSQKIGFWNATPVIQPATSGASAVFVSNAGTTITSTDTFDGYTIAQVVKALRNIGILG